MAVLLRPRPRHAPRPHRRRLDRRLLPAVAAALTMALAATGCAGESAAQEPRSKAASTPLGSTSPFATLLPSTQPSWVQGSAVDPAASGPASRPASAAGSPAAPVPAAIELPRGGRTIFPRYRLVGYAGSPFSPALGRLGIGGLDARGRELERQARLYEQNREILPVFELIATMATAFPGKGRLYRTRIDDATIRRYLAAARRNRALLLLNIQPGRADFLAEVRAYERWLREPDVGLALDPEWAVGPRQVPGRVYGRTTGAELDGVARYL